MGLMDMFRTSAGNQNQQMPQQAGQQQQGAQQQIVNPSAQPGGNNNVANAIVPTAAPGTQGTAAQVDAGIPINGDKKALTIDNFTDMWKQQDPTKQVADPAQWSRPKFDAKKIGDAVKNINFTQTIDPQLATKAMGGDAQAFMDVMNSVAQDVFNKALNATDAYHGQMLDRYDQSVNARIPKVVGNLESRQLLEASPGLSHPAVQPLVETVRNQMRDRYPDATPQEIATAAQNYLQQIAGYITTNQSESGNRQSQQTDGGVRKPAGRGISSRAVTDFSGFELQQ